MANYGLSLSQPVTNVMGAPHLITITAITYIICYSSLRSLFILINSYLRVWCVHASNHAVRESNYSSQQSIPLNDITWVLCLAEKAKFLSNTTDHRNFRYVYRIYCCTDFGRYCSFTRDQLACTTCHLSSVNRYTDVAFHGGPGTVSIIV